MKIHGIALGFAGISTAVAVAGGLWWWHLQPYERDVELVTGAAPPAALADHCDEAIGRPRVEAIGDRVFVALGFDLANTIVVRTTAGNVVIDPGMSPMRAAETRAALAEHAPGPTAAIVYTHSHVDHVGGASAWADEGTQIWATRAFADHFVKQYSVFRPIEMRRAQRQYGMHVDHDSLPCSAIGRRVDIAATVETGVRMPTHTFEGRHRLDVGGVVFDLVEAHGETHDQLFVHVPELGVLMPGDNYYRSFPNIYTIRGTAPRPVDAWIDSIDAMRRRAPDVLLPSHTLPIRGRDDVLAALTRYRDGIQWVRDRVIASANAGATPDEIAESIGLPKRLAEDPALAPLYGELGWSVRAIYTNHLGWFDGAPEHLYPLRNRDRAARELELMGGADRVWDEIDRAIKAEPRWALVLLARLRAAGAADPSPGRRWAVAKASSLEALAGGIGNSNGRGYLLESAHELRHGRVPPPVPEPTDELLDSIPIGAFFEVMATRLVPERSIDTHESVAFTFTDTGERFVVTVRHGVAEIVEGEALPATPEPIAAVSTTTRTWRRLAIGMVTPAGAVARGDLDITGDRPAFYTFSQRFERGL